MNEDFEPVQSYQGDVVLDVQKIADDPSLSIITRNLAQRLLKSEYLSIGSFFKSLTDIDIELLVVMTKIFHDDSHSLWHKAATEISVLTCLLGWSEGTLSSSENEDEKMVLLTAFIRLACLERRDFVTVNWQNFTLDEDLVGKELYTTTPDQEKMLDSLGLTDIILPRIIC